MEEVMCYLLPASICTFMVNKQLKKVSNQNLLLIYLISTLLIYLTENIIFLILNGKEAYKFFSVSFSIKYMLLAILLSFALGIIFSFISIRFTLNVEVKNEKKQKDRKVTKKAKN